MFLVIIILASSFGKEEERGASYETGCKLESDRILK